MGVKSTATLTRAQAVTKYISLRMEEENIRRKFEAEAVLLSDTKLEDELERLNDAVNGGEGFENYLIERKWNEQR